MRRGFTTLEVLIATALACLVLAMAIALMTGALAGTTRSEGKLDRRELACRALLQLRADLSNAVEYDIQDGRIWYRTRKGEGEVRPGVGPLASFGGDRASVTEQAPGRLTLTVDGIHAEVVMPNIIQNYRSVPWR